MAHNNHPRAMDVTLIWFIYKPPIILFFNLIFIQTFIILAFQTKEKLFPQIFYNFIYFSTFSHFHVSATKQLDCNCADCLKKRTWWDEKLMYSQLNVYTLVVYTWKNSVNRVNDVYVLNLRCNLCAVSIHRLWVMVKAGKNFMSRISYFSCRIPYERTLTSINNGVDDLYNKAFKFTRAEYIYFSLTGLYGSADAR